jgi:DNA-binding NtrC family response regulator
MRNARVLIIESVAALRTAMTDFIESMGFDTVSGDGDEQNVQRALTFRPDVAILDCNLPDGNASDLVARLRKMHPSIAIIALTEHGSIDLAIQALKQGADQFLTKPADLAALSALVRRLADSAHSRQNQNAEQILRERSEISPFLGTSAAIRRLSELAHRIATTEDPILIVGETGTGKRLLARWIHDHSARSSEVFVELKCGGFPGSFLERELFGDRTGVSDGEGASYPGLLEIGNQGTLFLDEISQLDAGVQPKLQRVLEDKEFRLPGDAHSRKVDFRLISTTHHDIVDLVKEKAFRSDLYFPISSVLLTVPSLRDRVEDIEILARHFTEHLAKDLGTGRPELSQGAISALQTYSWPGNIRELRNVLEHAMLVGGKRILTERDLVFHADTGSVAREGFARTLQQVQRQYIEEVLFREGWRVEAAAKKLGMPRSSLYQKIKAFNIPRPGAAPQSNNGADRRLQN